MIVIGLLWHDSSAKPLGEKIAQAVKRYQERLGGKPDTCYVNPACVEPGVHTITIKPSERILRHHLWLVAENGEVPTEDADPA